MDMFGSRQLSLSLALPSHPHQPRLHKLRNQTGKVICTGQQIPIRR